MQKIEAELEQRTNQASSADEITTESRMEQSIEFFRLEGERRGLNLILEKI